MRNVSSVNWNFVNLVVPFFFLEDETIQVLKLHGKIGQLPQSQLSIRDRATNTETSVFDALKSALGFELILTTNKAQGRLALARIGVAYEKSLRYVIKML